MSSQRRRPLAGDATNGSGQTNGSGHWKVRSSRYIVNDRFLRLRADTVELPDGRIVEGYYVRETRGFSVVFALTPDERVVLVRQYKHGVSDWVLELPAGGIDEGESPHACAQRELAEETGFVVDAPALEQVATFIVDPTNSNGRCHLFLARGARCEREQQLDPTEEIGVSLMRLDDLLSCVRAGTINGSTHVAAVYTVLDRLGRL